MTLHPWVPAHVLRFAAPIVASALILSACTSGSPSPGPEPGVSAGGTLELTMMPGDFQPQVVGDAFFSLDPGRDHSRNGWELLRCCLIRTLMGYDNRPGAGGRLAPDLAAGPPLIADDGLTWTFELRQGLHYAPPLEETPIVAQDVARALTRAALLGSATATYFSVIAGFDDVLGGTATAITGLHMPSDHTLVINLTAPTGDLGDRLSLPATAPIPPLDDMGALGAASGHDPDYGEYLVSSGPYMYEGSPRERLGSDDPTPGTSLNVPTSITLVRNPSWTPDEDPLRPAYVDRIHISVGGDGRSNSERVWDGEVDLQLEQATSTPQDILDRYDSDASLEERVATWDLPEVMFIPMNLAIPPFDELAVREAVSWAVNTSGLVNAALTTPSAQGVATGQLFRHIVPGASEGDLLTEYDPFPGKKGPERRARAGAAMARSSYDFDGDGRCDTEACAHVPVPVVEAGPMWALAETLKDDLHPIGIGLDLQPIGDAEWAQVVSNPETHAPLVIATDWVGDYPNASTFFLPTLSGEAITRERNSNQALLGATPVLLRRFGYSVLNVPSVEERIDRCLPLTGDEQTACWALLDKYLMAEIVPWVPFFVFTYAAVGSARLHGLTSDPLTSLPALEQLWLDPDASDATE